MADRKECFAPIPARAMADGNLSALDLRVLMALAAHDRMSRNGIGAYPSHKRLATLVGCHLKSLSRSLRTLAEREYVDADQHPVMRRLRVYRIIYTDDDKALLKRRIGNEMVTDDRGGDPPTGNEPATRKRPKGNKIAPNSGAIGNKDFQKTSSDQGVADVKVDHAKHRNRSREAENRNSTGVAPPVGGDAAMKMSEDSNPQAEHGRLLGQLERWWKGLEGKSLTPEDRTRLEAAVEACHEIEAEHEVGTKLHGWARRLADELGMLLDEATEGTAE